MPTESMDAVQVHGPWGAMRLAAFRVAFVAASSLVCLVCAPALVMPRIWAARSVRVFCRVTVWLEAVFLGLRAEVRGLEHLPPGACVVASRHEAAWETFRFPLLLEDPAIVVKRELLRVPLWGRFLVRAGMIPVDRGSGASALKGLLRGARAAAAENRPILIFPEGTRVAPGSSAPHRPGVAALYKSLKVPVVPVALNSGSHWPRGARSVRPGVVLIQFLPPIPPGLGGDEFTAILQQRLDEASAALRHELLARR
ncbi:lysophospholipid acyltransferase family protein [Azospirillum sp. ST 5-10]|uniref:lysophospholipid acyltransferase family protein n=1 Tax=unclassified Azospirillum TaxID=2630922 RepID=UPI003F4A1A64